MIWRILWHPKALRNLEKLPANIKQQIIKRVDKLQENPFHFLEHYEGQDVYKLRAGDYRALVDVDFENKTIKIQVFDHRRRVYKKLK